MKRHLSFKMRRYLSLKHCPFCGGHEWYIHRIVAGNVLTVMADGKPKVPSFTRVDGFTTPPSEATIWDRYHVDECATCGAFAT